MAKYLDRVRKLEGVTAVLLYGSLAKGLRKPFYESDIDIIVVARELPKNHYERRLHTLKHKEGAEFVEDIWVTPEELNDGIKGGWGLLLDAVADGTPLYDPQHLLAEAKEKVRKTYRRIGRIWALNPQKQQDV